MISLASSLALGQIVFFVWVILTEHKWIILTERRGPPAERTTEVQLDRTQRQCPDRPEITKLRELTARNVFKVFCQCLTNPPQGDEIEGILIRFRINRAKAEEFRDVIVGWIHQLPTAFLKSGGGWTLMYLVLRADGAQWGEQADSERLYVLAATLGLARFVFPREMYDRLPGGVPYVVFKG